MNRRRKGKNAKINQGLRRINVDDYVAIDAFGVTMYKHGVAENDPKCVWMFHSKSPGDDIA